MTCVYGLSNIVVEVTDHERRLILFKLNSADNPNYF